MTRREVCSPRVWSRGHQGLNYQSKETNKPDDAVANIPSARRGDGTESWCCQQWQWRLWGSVAIPAPQAKGQ